MKRPVPVESASALIDEKLGELGDWRGKRTLNLQGKSKPKPRRASGKRAG